MNINLRLLVPLASQWIESLEREILDRGQPLSDELKVFANKIGIKHPERVRILLVDAIPFPEHPELQQACKKTELISKHTAGLTLSYGILLRRDCKSELRIYKHELAHVLQYEQLGGITQFLNKYLNEVLTYGYSLAPMEKDARDKEVL